MLKHKKGPNLYERMVQTEAGRLARELREIHYNHSNKVGNKAKYLIEASDYLERIAFGELEEEVPKWVEELFEKSKKYL